MRKLTVLTAIVLIVAVGYFERHRIFEFLSPDPERPFRSYRDSELAMLQAEAERKQDLLRTRKPAYDPSNKSIENSNLYFEWQSAMKEQVLITGRISDEWVFRAELEEGDKKTKKVLLYGIPVLLFLGLVVPLIKGAGRAAWGALFTRGTGGKSRRFRIPGGSRKYASAMPLLAEITKGSTTKQEIAEWLGPPTQKVMFTELEAWTYIFENKEGEDDPNARFQGRGSYHSCIILFRGNLVVDYSLQVLFGPSLPKE